jgi:hypothetical protein
MNLMEAVCAITAIQRITLQTIATLARQTRPVNMVVAPVTLAIARIIQLDSVIS